MEYEIKLTQQELQLLFQGLGEIPLKVTLNLFSKLQQQVQEQDTAKAVPLADLGVKNAN